MIISKGKLQLDKRFSRGDARRRKFCILLVPQAIQQGGMPGAGEKISHSVSPRRWGCPAQEREFCILLVPQAIQQGGKPAAGEIFFCICDSHKRISKGGRRGGEARRRRIFFGIGVVFYTISHSESIENYHRIPKISPAAPSDRVTGDL